VASDSQAARDPIDTEDVPTTPLGRWEERRRDRWSGDNGAIVGLVLIALGIIFLLHNSGLFYLNNWWALFIFIPAGGALASAWRAYRVAGNRITPAARGSLTAGLVLTAVALIFLLNLNWGLVWPVLLIIAGGSLLLGGRLGR
jgi:hypothetical protein